MKLVVGLGNPGKKFKNSRHNVGFIVIDKFARELEVENWESSKKAKAIYAWVRDGGEKIELLKPQTSMNTSGFSVAYAQNKHRELENNDIYVIHDDLDIELGEYKIQKGKGPREHKGVLDIERKLGSKDFWRVRVGIENRRRGLDAISGEPSYAKAMEGKNYVLMKFNQEELLVLKDVVMKVVEDLQARLIH